MDLVSHTKNELQLAGYFDKGEDYGGRMGENVLQLMEAFAKQGHSGYSAQVCLALFEKLARFKTLTPLTSDPSEWEDRTAMSSSPLWQNKRDFSYFSKDGGKTWYCVDEQ